MWKTKKTRQEMWKIEKRGKGRKTKCRKRNVNNRKFLKKRQKGGKTKKGAVNANNLKKHRKTE